MADHVLAAAEPPPAAGLVLDFVNTREPQTGAEALAAPADLARWLAERQLLPARATLRASDLATARAIREGLRAALGRHAGHPVDPAALEALNEALATVPLRLAFTADGHHLAALDSSTAGQALARLLDAIRQSAEDQTWSNLKVCARESCRWAFYDASRNHARRWCSMAGCGNHIKMQRAYAARRGRRSVPPPPTG